MTGEFSNYELDQVVVLPERLWVSPIPTRVAIENVDTERRCVQVTVGCHAQTVSFEELDAAAEAVAR